MSAKICARLQGSQPFDPPKTSNEPGARAQARPSRQVFYINALDAHRRVAFSIPPPSSRSHTSGQTSTRPRLAFAASDAANDRSSSSFHDVSSYHIWLQIGATCRSRLPPRSHVNLLACCGGSTTGKVAPRRRRALVCGATEDIRRRPAEQHSGPNVRSRPQCKIPCTALARARRLDKG
jgi:hypothetical protein